MQFLQFKKVTWQPLILMVLLMGSILLTGCSGPKDGAVTSANDGDTTRTSTQVAQETQETQAIKFSADIDDQYLEDQLRALIAPQMAGRLPGTEGNALATQYIVEQMTAMGLEAPSFAPNYTQNFEMDSPIKQKASYIHILNSKSQPLLTLDYGADFVEYISEAGLKRQGSIEGAVYVADDLEALKAAPSGCVLLLPTEEVGYMFLANRKRYDNDFKAILMPNSRQNSGEFLPSVYLQGVSSQTANEGPLAYWITPRVMDQLLELIESDQILVQVQTDIAVQGVEVSNVVGFLPGKLDQGYIITGHFDHLGSNLDGTVNTGALDNASGTAAMLSLAKALSEVENRQFSYYFVGFNGEEEGLLGAYSLAQQHAIDNQNYKMINLDMIGASQPCPIFIDATQASSDDFQRSFMEHFKEAGFEVKATSMGFSDHAAFEEADYEALLVIEFDERYYHTVNDTYEKSIDIVRLSSIANTVLNWLEVH